MAMPVRKLYWVTAAVFLFVVFLSYHKSNIPYYNKDQQQQQDSYDTSTSYDDIDKDYENHTGSGIKQPLPSTDNPPKTEQIVPQGLPNKSKQYDTLVVIPSNWLQIQNRRWVRDAIFGIKNNLEPCKKYDGRIIYKFYIHGHSTWEKTGIHSAQYMQAQVRDLYGEFMEFNDYEFTNKTVTKRHALWGDALDWAVNTFVPQEHVKVDKVLIFDSNTVVNLPRMEETIRQIDHPDGFIHTWAQGETSNAPFAAMVSYPVLEQLLKNRAAIKENNDLVDLVTAATLYYTNPAPKFKIIKGKGQLWASDIDQVLATSAAVGQVYQFEDWMPIVEKMAFQPTPACAVDQDRKKNIALLTSSYIYVDMCMAEASLPSAENKREYATKHGYDFVARGAEFAQEDHRGRRLVWGKIGAIQKVLPHYEWLFWMDMDAVVADLDKDLRDIIRQAEERKPHADTEISLIVAKPIRDKMLNAGVMLIKNTAWSRDFLNEVQTKVDWYRKSSYEQAAIWEVMNDPKFSPGVFLFDKDDHTMNTFPKQYDVGDFIIHFAPAGCPSVPVLEALKLIKNGESAKGVGAE
ncbi:hypothetical protein KVV02_000006 [Mortierella alpina]|uniref:Glycosyltransferase family 34 protein n=1 Tax=Mortierella alpina TaxID=64518 RepID=A0A9P8A5L3_MORAP|nr:hypothetical protein KVV02_000006 [Mortierella alpina]